MTRKIFWVYETDRLTEVSRSVWPMRKNADDYDREFQVVELKDGEIVISRDDLKTKMADLLVPFKYADKLEVELFGKEKNKDER